MQPSRIEAWSPESAMTVSPGARIVPRLPRFAWAAQRPPVRDDVGLPGRAQDLRALVIAGLGEDVDGGRHVGCRGHARGGPPRRVQARAEGVHEAAVAPLS